MDQCVVCGGVLTYHRMYKFGSRIFRGIYNGEKIYRCTSCTLSQVDMSLVNSKKLEYYYAQEYRVVANAGAISPIARALWKQRGSALTDLVRKHQYGRKVGRIFEVGAGYGFNLMALAGIYPDATLLTDEVSEVVESDASIEKGGLADGPFDVIVMSHVLEHFEKPEKVLIRAGQALAPGGVIVLEVPNDVDHIERYNGVDEPHLSFFEFSSLSHLLSRIPGVRVVEIYTAGPSVTRLSPTRRARQALRQFVHAIPMMSRILTERAVGKICRQDFGQPNPQGVFLRAVLRR